MVKIMVEDGTSSHTGSTCDGPITGSVLASQSFTKIEGVNIIVEGDVITTPSHNNPPCGTPVIEGHSQPVDSLAQSFVLVEGDKIAMINDGTSTNTTTFDNTGSNTFVDVS